MIKIKKIENGILVDYERYSNGVYYPETKYFDNVSDMITYVAGLFAEKEEKGETPVYDDGEKK